MALQQAFSSQSTAPIRLRQITTIPTTEDLRYVLATATQHKKPAELPFKNLYNGLLFMVRVAPATGQIAPRWTFERSEARGQVHLWTRETHEVIMIQGKIKIEANYTGEGSAPEPVDLTAQTTTGSQAIVLGSPEISAYNLPSMGEQLDRDNYVAVSPPVDLESSGNWLFTDGALAPITLPPPVALSNDVVKNYLGALTNPKTGLIRHSAFEFFLLRDLTYQQRCNVPLSVLVFDFGPDTEVTVEALATLCDILQAMSSPVEICTQLKSDEYAVLLCGYGKDDATSWAQSLTNKLHETAAIFADCQPFKDITIGIAVAPDTTSDAGTLIAAATKAMSLAREAKKDFMVFPLS